MKNSLFATLFVVIAIFPAYFSAKFILIKLDEKARVEARVEAETAKVLYPNSYKADINYYYLKNLEKNLGIPLSGFMFLGYILWLLIVCLAGYLLRSKINIEGNPAYEETLPFTITLMSTFIGVYLLIILLCNLDLDYVYAIIQR